MLVDIELVDRRVALRDRGIDKLGRLPAENRRAVADPVLVGVDEPGGEGQAGEIDDRR